MSHVNYAIQNHYKLPRKVIQECSVAIMSFARNAPEHILNHMQRISKYDERIFILFKRFLRYYQVGIFYLLRD